MPKFLNVASVQVDEFRYFLISGPASDFLFDGSNWIDITSTEKATGLLAGDFNRWTTCKLGRNVVVNTPEYYPEYWTGQVGTKLQALPFNTEKSFAERRIKCKAIRSHENFLFAINLTEQGIELPYSYRWSHPADENGIPFSWDETDLSTLASKESIGGDYGVLVDGLSIRDSFCLYAERAIHVLDYTGDDFVFRKRLLTSSYGCLSQNCIVEAENLHYVMALNDIIINDGTSVQSLLTDQLKNVYKNLSQQYYKSSFAVVNTSKNEIWFCFPEGNYTFVSCAIVYNYVTKKFGVTRLVSPLGLGTISSICHGMVLPESHVWDSLDESFLTWDTWNLPISSYQHFTGIGYDGEAAQLPNTNYSNIWDLDVVSPLYTDLFCVGPEFTHLCRLDVNNDLASVDENFVTFYEKTNWAIDNQLEVKTLTRFYPHIKAEDFVINLDGTYTPIPNCTSLLFVGAHDYNNSEIRWNAPISFNPITDRKIDVKITGELLAFRFEFRNYRLIEFYGFEVEFVTNGAR